MGGGISRQDAIEQLNQSDAKYFNRQEMKNFLELFMDDPKYVRLMLGPNGSGKTKFLKQFKRIWMGDKTLSRIAPILYVDCQNGNVKTCADAAHVLMRSIMKLQDKLAEVAESSPFTISVPLDSPFTTSLPNTGFRAQAKPGDLMQAMFPGKSHQSDMLYVLYRVFHIIELNEENTCPIFLFDEIADFKNWEENELNRFGRMLKAITASSARAFVIMSTSESFFGDWFRKVLPYRYPWFEFGIGFLTPSDARKYMFNFVIPKLNEPSLPPLDDTKWTQVFRACGGMPPLLSHCAEGARELQSWEKAVEQVLLEALCGLRDIWGSRYFRKLCGLLVVQGGFVAVADVRNQVFDGNYRACEQELRVMIKANLIHIRWSQINFSNTDFTPPDESRGCEYVTFKTPAIMAAVKLKIGAELLCQLLTC